VFIWLAIEFKAFNRHTFSQHQAKEACAVLYHIVLEGRRKPIIRNVITAHAIQREAVIPPLVLLWLENFSGSQVQGSITLLKFKMSRMVAEYIEALANQFGGKNREIINPKHSIWQIICIIAA
jgi:hypothetical protein